jgi:hypothetical protein
MVTKNGVMVQYHPIPPHWREISSGRLEEHGLTDLLHAVAGMFGIPARGQNLKPEAQPG